jgi:membrane-bound lytic murein transglycosylase D
VRYHTVRRGQTLSSIAELYGVSVAELKAWNQLREDHIRIGQRLRIYLPAPRQYTLHRVRPGETAQQIARRYGVSVAQLRRWNPESFRGKTLLAGTTLRIYRPVSSKPAVARGGVRLYTVRAGDTLFSIAQRFGVSVEELRAYNELDGDRIRVGQRLRIPQ